MMHTVHWEVGIMNSQKSTVSRLAVQVEIPDRILC